MTDIKQIIRAAIPTASEELCGFILWEKTPFPMGRVSARKLYKAASTYKRACDNDIQLCDLCDNKVTHHKFTCDKCYGFLRSYEEQSK